MVYIQITESFCFMKIYTTTEDITYHKERKQEKEREEDTSAGV